MFTVKSHFMGSFKIGDNICYNLDVLHHLYDVFNSDDAHQKQHLCKPITLTIISIVEAVLHDFFCVRVKLHTIEGITGISDNTLQDIRDKKLDELNVYIDQARKHNILQSADGSFYDELHDLRKIRNRIHIQNANGHTPRDEGDVFTEAVKKEAEKKLEYTMKIMSRDYGRSKSRHGNNDFTLPWSEHFPQI